MILMAVHEGDLLDLASRSASDFATESPLVNDLRVGDYE